VLYSGAVSRLRRPFLSDRFFSVTVRLLKRRSALRDADFRFLALAFRRARVLHPFLMTAWVFLPDHWRAICAPVYPLTICVVVKSIPLCGISVNLSRFLLVA
jgi:REP element-mobilizing transposase RayT